MTHPPIFTSETMATRALAAEIRHSPQQFVELLATRTEVAGLGAFRSVQCEGAERVDAELKFDLPHQDTVVGIEAKIDHELTDDQVGRQLAVVDHLVVLLPTVEFAPEWLKHRDRVSVISWAEALECFDGSRLTTEDINSMPVSKSTVEHKFRTRRIDKLLPDAWRVDIRRGARGMPAIEIESPRLPNDRTLRGQIQVAGQGMPDPAEEIRIEYSIGVAVPATEDEYPDPTVYDHEPGWIAPLRTLYREVLKNRIDDLLVSTHPPGNGTSELGRRKKPLVEKHLPDQMWLAKGYTDGWALGIKSVKLPLTKLDDLVETTVEIFTSWYNAEASRLAFTAGE